MDIKRIDVTQYDLALRAQEIQATAFRYSGGYRRVQQQIEQARPKQEPLADPAREDPVSIPWGAFQDDELIAMMYAIDFNMAYENQSVGMIGIGGVATMPEHRRHGAIRAIMHKVLSDARTRGFVFSYLYPFSYRFYHKFGYDIGCHRHELKIPMKELAHHGMDGRMRAAGFKDLASFDAIYRRFAAGINGAVLRTGNRWKMLLDKNPALDQRWAYIWCDDHNRERAYVIYERQDNPQAVSPDEHFLKVVDWAAVDQPSLRALLGFLTTFSPQYQAVVMNLPVHLPADSLFEEMSAIRCQRTTNGQVRILNVEAALRVLNVPSWLDEQAFLLHVADQFLPENSGVYDLTCDHGEISVVHRTQDGPDEADLTIGVEALSSLLLGSRSLQELRWSGLASFSSAAEPRLTEWLEAMLTIKPAGIFDYF